MNQEKLPEKNSSNNQLLGNFSPKPESFPSLDKEMNAFRNENFLSLPFRKRFKQINQILCRLIQDSPAESFLLGAVLDFFDRVNKEKILKDPLTFATFEFWLNQFSGFSQSENYALRAKIVGKYLQRSDYQSFFPIGMEKTYSGSHFVTSHLSPDVDTMIASFWGWIDAFGARIGTSLHFWCLPGGPPESPITTIFSNLFGKGVFQYLPRFASTITLTALDLLNQKNFVKEKGDASINQIEHGAEGKAVILVNEEGNYLGDWRNSDLEIIMQVTNLFKSCLHWFENNLHSHLIALFSKTDLSIKDLPLFYSAIFEIKISHCLPAQEFNERQKHNLNLFLKKILHVEKGLEGTFSELNQALNRLSLSEMCVVQYKLKQLQESPLFDSKGILKENRSLIFSHLQQLLDQLDEAILKVRKYVERLDVCIEIKKQVLAIPSHTITLGSEVEEIRYKIQNYDYLTVVLHENNDALFPVGVVRANDVREAALGTVSFRDFCNYEEVRMAPYLEVISIVDHHKSSLKTFTVPTALIGDAQSCNTLIAEQMFVLNDKYSLGGMTPEEIEEQIKEVSSNLNTPINIRLFQRLLQKRIICNSKGPFYIHPYREFNEYLSFLHAILDDTDLLTKVSHRDVECVSQLLNRLKSLSLKKEMEIISLDDIPRDKNFIKTAVQRILQQEDMHSLYQQVYQVKEEEIDANLALAAKGSPSTIFLDTKEQNGCARVGQTKMFLTNFTNYLKHATQIRQAWLEKSKEVHKNSPEIDLYIHMISTIAGADEVYQNQIGPYSHKDELWFWIPFTQQSYQHLNSFLGGFHEKTKDFIESMELEFIGNDTEELERAFARYFPQVITRRSSSSFDVPVTILRFKAGALNSRKAMISPCLPRLIS